MKLWITPENVLQSKTKLYWLCSIVYWVHTTVDSHGVPTASHAFSLFEINRNKDQGNTEILEQQRDY